MLLDNKIMAHFSRLKDLPDRLPGRTIMMLSAIVTALALAGCGGGTTGTGEPGTPRIQGVLIEPDGSPIAEAQVVISQSGDSATTDSEGRFEIVTSLSGPRATLMVQRGSTVAAVDIEGIPAGESIVKVVLELNQQTGVIILAAVNITPVGSPTPAQGPPANTATPSPTGTADGDSSGQKPGTGRSIFQGTAWLSNGQPAWGALIRIVRTGVQAPTNQNGFFRINTPSVSGAVRIAVRYGNFQGYVTVPNVPRQDVVVTMQIILALPLGAPTLPPTPGFGVGNNQPMIVELTNVSISKR